MRHKRRVLFRRNTPHLFQMGLVCIFFRMRPTCVWDISPIISSSTARSDISLSVHLLLPCGGALQASAIIFASTSPVHLAGTGGVSRFFRLIPFVASDTVPLSRKCFFMSCTACGVMPSIPAITLSFCFFLPSDSSASKRTFALRISIAPLIPLRTVFSSVLRCSLVNSILYVLYFELHLQPLIYYTYELIHISLL